MKVFNIYNEEFVIDNDFEKYNEYRKAIFEVVRISIQEFDKTYKEHITDLDILINKTPEFAKAIIMNVISAYAIRALVQEGIANISAEMFLEKYYYKYLNFDEYFDPLLEKYVEITEASESLRQYREMQKASRSRWQGGGFGVKGAIKGAMTAGALNMGTDILRSFGDSSKANRDARKINSLKEELYNNPSTYGSLRRGIYSCTFGVFYGLIDELVENKIINEIPVDSNQAQVIFDNTFKYEKDPEKILRNTIKSLKMNPYDFEVYKLIIDRDPDNKEILDMASFFGFDEEIEDILNERNRKQINLEFYFTQDEINSKKYDLKMECEYLSRNNGGEPSLEDIKRKGNFLANKYSDGDEECPEDLERAFYWYNRAASLGDNIAKSNLALCYLNGEGIEQDYKQAVKLMEEICVEDYEDNMIQYELGKCYFKGLGVDKDYQKAHHWFEKSETVNGEYYLGIMYEEGKGVEKNIEKAKKYFLNASASALGEEKELAIECLEKYENINLSKSEQRQLDINKGKEPKETLFGKILGVVIWFIFAYMSIKFIPWSIIKYIVSIFCVICGVSALIDEIKKVDSKNE